MSLERAARVLRDAAGEQWDKGKRLDALAMSVTATTALRRARALVCAHGEEHGLLGRESVNFKNVDFNRLDAAYVAALPSFEKYAKEQHGAWVVHVENKITPSLRQRLENRLLTFRDAGDGADVDAFAATTEDGIETADGENAATGSPKGLHLLKVNFDDALLIASEETKHFERMYFQIPSTCSTLAGNREKYRQMREEGTSRGFPKAGGTTFLPPCS